jgi:hypothetical protein
MHANLSASAQKLIGQGRACLAESSVRHIRGAYKGGRGHAIAASQTRERARTHTGVVEHDIIDGAVAVTADSWHLVGKEMIRRDLRRGGRARGFLLFLFGFGDSLSAGCGGGCLGVWGAAVHVKSLQRARLRSALIRSRCLPSKHTLSRVERLYAAEAPAVSCTGNRIVQAAAGGGGGNGGQGCGC